MRFQMTPAPLCFGDDAVPNTRFSPTPTDLKIRLPLSEIADLEAGDGEEAFAKTCAARESSMPRLPVSRVADRRKTDREMADQLDAVCQQLNESSAIDAALTVLPFYRDDPQGDPRPIGYYVVACPLPASDAPKALFFVIHRVRADRFEDDCKAIRAEVLRYAGVGPAAATAQPLALVEPIPVVEPSPLGSREAPVDPWQSTIELLRAAIATAARLAKSARAQEAFEAAA